MRDVLVVVAAALVGVGLFSGYQVVSRHLGGDDGDDDRSAGPSASASRGAPSVPVVAAAIGAFVAGWLIGALLSGIPVFGLPVGLAAMGVPRAVNQRQREARRRRIRSAWPDALRMLNASLLSGVPLSAAMLRLEREGPDALVPFWARYRRLVSTSNPASALRAMKAEQQDPFVDRLVEVLVQAAHAGPATAVEILSDLAVALSEDLILETHIQTANLEQKINSQVVGYLPTVALFMVGLSTDDYRDFYTSTAGMVVVVVGSALSMFGLYAVDVLSRNVTEERLLTAAGGS